MKFIICIFILFAFKNTYSQRILQLDGFIGLLCINANSKVSIRTDFTDTLNNEAGGIYEYEELGNTIQARFLNYEDSATSIPYSKSLYGHWPEYIKIRNNCNSIISMPYDSLVYDKQNRIVESFRFSTNPNSTIGPQSRIIKQFYYSNEGRIVFEKEFVENSLGATLYYFKLDKNGNLLEEFSLDNADKIRLIESDLKQVTWTNKRIYKYKRRTHQIVSVRYYKNNFDNSPVINDQKFIYKNGRPISSFLFDIRNKVITYRQRYCYQ